MNLLTLTVMLAATQPGDSLASELRFGGGRLTGWEQKGHAFYVTSATGRGPSLACGVCSSDRDKAGRGGWLRKVFVVPTGVSEIRFSAYSVQPGAAGAGFDDPRLDVLLLAPGKLVLPLQVLTANGWQPAASILPRQAGRARTYRWQVAAYAGHTLQIVIGDQDNRPGCYLFCSGFGLVGTGEDPARTFSRFMDRLAEQHKLAPMARYDSRHFTAISNADDKFSRQRLKNCELIYRVFFEHFPRKGFTVQKPSSRLMVAIFDSPDGFNAYLGQKMAAVVIGMYHSSTNRLVIYDYGRNEQFVASQRWALAQSRNRGGRVDNRYVDTVQRWARERRTGANIGLIMHEVAHQLSFNTGLLNRHGDVPAWLAEGFACYCEATDNGAWQGIGQPDCERVDTLALALERRGNLFAVADLLASDQWRQFNGNPASILTGYAQSWALFRMLMEEQPRAMRKYLTLIYDRRTPDHRLTDFREVFGGDLRLLDRRHQEYIKRMVEDYRRPNR